MKIAEVESLVVGGGQFVRITTDSAWSGPARRPAGVPRRRRPGGPDVQAVPDRPGPAPDRAPLAVPVPPGAVPGSVLSGAVSAVDIALWDVKGQHYQAPIWELLGGRCRDKIRLHLLMGGGTPEQVHAKAKAAAEEGFTAIKWDPIPAGFQNMSLAALIGGAVDQVAAAREAVGRDVDIILELHRKLTPLQAIPLCHALAEFRPLLIEDPAQIDSIQSRPRSRPGSTAPWRTASGCTRSGSSASCWWPGGAQYVRRRRPGRRITHMKKIAAVAESFHAGMVPHNFLGPILTAASVHVDTSIPNFTVQEYSKVDEQAVAFPGHAQARGRLHPRARRARPRRPARRGEAGRDRPRPVDPNGPAAPQRRLGRVLGAPSPWERAGGGGLSP